MTDPLKMPTDHLFSGEPRCEGLRSYLMTVAGRPQTVYVRCNKVAEHRTKWHDGKSPVTGKHVKWDDSYAHARYLEEVD